MRNLRLGVVVCWFLGNRKKERWIFFCFGGVGGGGGLCEDKRVVKCKGQWVIHF